MKNEIMERPIEYVTDTGTEVKLTAGMVRHFLVSGKSELATDQEIIYFMKLCQARKLNPFLKECYLIKYDNSPAAIITARSTFQNNARMSDDCQGWKFGVIVQDDKGFVKRTAGLVLDNQKIVGGWFSAKPKGWDEPFELEVNLSHYIKTTQAGRPTQFWTPEKQAGMIAKVAEVQGLRTLWGKNTAGMYEADEIVGNGDTVGFPKPKIDTDDTGYKGIPSMSYLPEDFDKEFETEIADPEWKGFWQRSVDWHAHQKPPKTGAELKKEIISGGHEQIGRVRAAFVEFVTEKQTKKKDDAHPDLDPEQKFIDEWWNMKSAGFSTYVFRNLERFKTCLPETLDKAKAKWAKIYPKDGWPGDNVESYTENDPAWSPPPEDDDLKNPVPDEHDEFNKLVMSDRWQEMSALKAEYPTDYARITGGQTPMTAARVDWVISELEKVEGDHSGIPG